MGLVDQTQGSRHEGELNLEPQAQPGDLKLAHYVVALVDVLGQRSKLCQLGSIPQIGAEETKVHDVLRETVGRVDKVRQAFEQAVMTHMQEIRCSLPMTQDQQASLEQLNKFEPPRIQSFSDTVVFFAPVANSAQQPTIAAVSAFLAACARVQLFMLGAHVPIRGAIDVGLGIDYWANEIYGPILVQVHELEQTVAQLPRIVVGDGLLQYMRHAEAQWQGSSIADQFQCETVKHCRGMISNDMDGVNSVDFLGKTARTIYTADTHFLDDAKRALEFVAREHERFVQARDQKHAERYGRLRCYLSTRLSEVG